MKWFRLFFTETCFGAVICWIAYGVFSLVLGGLFGSKSFSVWFGALIAHALMTLCVIAVAFMAMQYRQWVRGILLCLCAAGGCIFYNLSCSAVSMFIFISEGNRGRLESSAECAAGLPGENFKWTSAGFADGIPFAFGWGVSKSSGGISRIEFKSGKAVGVMGEWRKRRQNVYRMQDGAFLVAALEGSSWGRMYRVDATNEVVFCAYNGRWARVSDEPFGIKSVSTGVAHDNLPERTVVELATTTGRVVSHGNESIGIPFLGSSYVGCLKPDGNVVSVCDPVFEEALRQTKEHGTSWDGKAEYGRFFSIFSRIFNGNREALRKYMENSPDWEIANEDADHLCAFRTFHAGDESCAVRLNLTGKKPGSRIAAKGRCRNPNAGYYAASRALIEELKHLDPEKDDAARERGHD